VAPKSRYQQQLTKLLLFFGSKLTTIVSKKSTLSFDSFSFDSSSTVLVIGSASITSSFPLINLLLKLETLLVFVDFFGFGQMFT